MTRRNCIFRAGLIVATIQLSVVSCRKVEALEPVVILTALLTGIPRPVAVDQSTAITGHLEWDRCTFGQEFRYGIGDCRGAGSAEDDYGALPVSYCSSDDSSCNDSIEGLLAAPKGDARSDLYNACNGAITAGKTGWRVPTIEELKSLIECSDGSIPEDATKGCPGAMGERPVIDLSLFASTVPGDYWTAESSTEQTASSVSFGRGYSDDSAYKSFKKYVRCVRDR